MRRRRHWLLVLAVLAISACSLYSGGSEHTSQVTAPDAGISDHDGGCGGAHDGGGYGGDDAGYSNDGGGYGGYDGGNDGGIVTLPDAWPQPDAH